MEPLTILFVIYASFGIAVLLPYILSFWTMLKLGGLWQTVGCGLIVLFVAVLPVVNAWYYVNRPPFSVQYRNA